jgi:hypothetical protein
LFRTFTFWLTVAAIALCLYNLTGLDRDNFLLFNLSVPVWVLEYFVDIHIVPFWIVYALTVATWTIMGIIVDRGIRATPKARS